MAAAFTLLVPTASLASPVAEETESAELQTAEGVELPRWIEGEMHENFDIRIWPEGVVIWLEQENLRDLIADPDLPDAERESLQQVLAHQEKSDSAG